MDVYRTEEEQIAAIKGWWRRNGLSVAIAALLAIGCYAGWKWYQHDRLERSLEAASLYQSMMQSLQQSLAEGGEDAAARATLAGTQLIDKHGSSVYAHFAALLLASDAVERDDLAAAEKYLEAARGVDDKALAAIATDRLARVVSAQGRHDQALALLDGKVPEQLLAGREEVRGDILLAQGKRAEARAAWQRALDATAEADGARGLLEMKLGYVAAD